MSVAKMTVGKSGAGGANADYITRKKAAEKIAFKNLKQLEAKNRQEARTNAIAYAQTREDVELTKNKKGRTHYRMILSWDRKETSERVIEETQKYLDTVLPKSKAIIAAHQDTDHSHAHVWIDARQTDGKKIHLGKKTYQSFDERWAEQFDDSYGTSYAPEYKAKKEETKKWKKKPETQTKKIVISPTVTQFVRETQPRPPKPERAADNFDKTYWRKKELENLGAKNNEKIGHRADQPNAAATDRFADKSERFVDRSEQLIDRSEQFADRAKRFVGKTVYFDAQAESFNNSTEQRNAITSQQNDGTLPKSYEDSGQQPGNESESGQNEDSYQHIYAENHTYNERLGFSANEFESEEIPQDEFYEDGHQQDFGNGAADFERTAGTFSGIQIPAATIIELPELPELEIDKSQALVTDMMKMINDHLERENRQISDRAAYILVEHLESRAGEPATPAQITFLDKFNEKQEEHGKIYLEEGSRLEASHKIMSVSDEQTNRQILDATIENAEKQEKQEKAAVRQHPQEMEMGFEMSM